MVDNIKPFDDLEQKHKEDTLAWIKSGEPIFRRSGYNTPPKHLVCYFVLLDTQTSQVLLVDHKKGELWLPTGGHVDIDEDPNETVKRECLEELQVTANFLFEEPIFITSTPITIGLTAGNHIDVSLWYALKGEHHLHYHYDINEFHQIKWFHLHKIPFSQSDPHMHRFIEKLKIML